MGLARRASSLDGEFKGGQRVSLGTDVLGVPSDSAVRHLQHSGNLSEPLALRQQIDNLALSIRQIRHAECLPHTMPPLTLPA